MAPIVFDADDYWNPSPFEQERQLWWSFAHANSERIEEILSTWNKPLAHFCDQERGNSPLHNAAWHVEKFPLPFRDSIVAQLVNIGIDVDALNNHGHTAMHLIGARMGLLSERTPHGVGANLEFIAQLLRNGAGCVPNAQGEHPLVEFLAHCQSKNEVRNILDLFCDNGADVNSFLSDVTQITHPRIAQWSAYLARRAAGEQQQRIAGAVGVGSAPNAKRKM